MRQMLVHSGRDSLQTAILQDGRLMEFDMEKFEAAGRLVGSIYKGKVMNVLPGMQAAFVDIGLAKNAFLYIDDVLHPHLERQPKEKPPITDLLTRGQELIVQVVKEPLGGKGARVTTHYSLPGRFLVYMPHADYIGVSKKVNGEAERGRLRGTAEAIRQAGEGIIMRTAAGGEAVEALEADVAFLRQRWHSIEQQAVHHTAPSELHREAGLSLRIVRDYLTAETDEIWVDDRNHYAEMELMVKQMAPSLAPRLKLHRQNGSVFDYYRVRDQLHEAFDRRIRLISGGDLVWDTTEALTVIDVNTGKYVGTSHLEDTVFRTNMEAAEQIARLLRLRDTGGIIIVDFIDMELEGHREEVLRRLESLVRLDRTKCQIVGWTRLGLLELTRKKVREHASSHRLETCPICKGKGKVQSSPQI
ncbi:ribonuclease G [Paenibacillus phyllosphaerae]|uniref:Ribonuclease G n=1 Tax=Paenibacillus phyllosphaerae TaxID=274593 RepID=A0A7W5AWJ7_9BACL|nr:Rne/Rng family ribonuclease [Paenibacillus phyllosphaerae]MBB3109907.1 ribonuclease G [Paenibacillus phyllosphaerae]